MRNFSTTLGRERENMLKNSYFMLFKRKIPLKGLNVQNTEWYYNGTIAFYLGEFFNCFLFVYL